MQSRFLGIETRIPNGAGRDADPLFVSPPHLSFVCLIFSLTEPDDWDCLVCAPCPCPHSRRHDDRIHLSHCPKPLRTPPTAACRSVRCRKGLVGTSLRCCQTSFQEHGWSKPTSQFYYCQQQEFTSLPTNLTWKAPTHTHGRPCVHIFRALLRLCLREEDEKGLQQKTPPGVQPQPRTQKKSKREKGGGKKRKGAPKEPQRSLQRGRSVSGRQQHAGEC